MTPQALEAAKAEIEQGLAAIAYGGASVALVAGDHQCLSAWGEAHPGEPMSVATSMHICSCTKAFTAYLAARVLNISGSIRPFIPEFDLGDAWLNDHCSFRDLAAMRVGLSRQGLPEWGVAADMDVRERLSRVRHLPRSAPFRERFTYSNLCYVALGLAASRSGDTSLADLFESEVTRPLGLKHSAFSAGSANCLAASAYLPIGDVLTPVRELTGPSSYGSAGIVLSAVDAAVWLKELCEAARGSTHGKLDGAILREMMMPVTPLAASDGVPALYPERHFYGYGFFVGEWLGRRLVRHGGGGRGLRTSMALFPDEGLAVMLTATCEVADIEALALQALAALTGEKVELVDAYRGFSARGAEAARLSWARSREPFEGGLSEGRFQNGATGLVCISQNGDEARLVVEDGPMFDATLSPTDSQGFQCVFDEPALSAQPFDPPFGLRVRADGALATSYWGILERTQ